MMRAVLALLCLLEGATCRVTRREGQVPPSKTIKKVDCGGWNHPDSEENTRKTVYGKIGMACLDEKKSSSDHFAEPGTGFDDDTPPNRTHFWNLARTDRDDDDFEHADPYVCWNKHLYKAYVVLTIPCFC